MFMHINFLNKEYITTELNKDTIDYHQNINKLYYNCFKNYKNNIENIKELLFDWLFSLDINKRFAMCSLDNNFVSKIIEYVYRRYTESQKIILKFSKKDIIDKNLTKNIIKTNTNNEHISDYNEKNIYNSEIIAQLKKDYMIDEIESIIHVYDNQENESMMQFIF